MMPVAGDAQLLPEIDGEFLAEKGFNCEVAQSAGEVRVLIRDFPFPARYTPSSGTLMLRLPAGYPNANPDMFWTYPDVRLISGAYPLNADYHDPTAGGWQRWSRHDFNWRGGVDDLRTKIASVRRELEKGR
jgi:E2/UBC family protein E